jgi:hypothetical protein
MSIYTQRQNPASIEAAAIAERDEQRERSERLRKAQAAQDRKLKAASEIAIESTTPAPAEPVYPRPPEVIEVSDIRWISQDPMRGKSFPWREPKLRLRPVMNDDDRATDEQALRLIALKTSYSPSTVEKKHREHISQLISAGAGLDSAMLNALRSDLEAKKAEAVDKFRIADHGLKTLVDSKIRPRVVQLLKEEVLPLYRQKLAEIRAQERALAKSVGLDYVIPTETERSVFFKLEQLESFVSLDLQNKSGELTIRGLLSKFVTVE